MLLCILICIVLLSLRSGVSGGVVNTVWQRFVVVCDRVYVFFFTYMYAIVGVSFGLCRCHRLSSVNEMKFMENNQLRVFVFASPSLVKSKNS